MNSKQDTILIVEDLPGNITILNQILRDEYTVKIAKDGKRALEIVAECLPDLILLDIMMPEMDGYEVCARLKENPVTKDIPVIFLTAKTSSDDIVKGFNYGGVDYVTKPFNPTELLARVKTHLELINSRKQMKLYTDELKMINSELTNASDLSNSKVDYLTKRINKVLNDHKNIDTHLKLVKKLVPLLAVNDLGNLKLVCNILEGSQSIIDLIIKEASDEEDYFRLLSSAIEPLKTAISDIEGVIHVLISIGLIPIEAIKEAQSNNKTAFFEALDSMLQSGKLSHENFEKLLDLSHFDIDNDEKENDDSIVFF